MDIITLIVGAVLGAIPSWFISRSFALRSSIELDKKLKEQTKQINSTATLVNFERLLETSKWVKEYINNEEIWVCEENRTFQLKIGDDDRKFHEKWTEVFPDPYTTMFHIHLMVQGVTIKSLPFISADGGRYTLPLPELVVVNDEPAFYWSPNSIEYKIAEVIGNFYRYGSLKEVANFTKIQLHHVANHA